jgi:hypothetical protein
MRNFLRFQARSGNSRWRRLTELRARSAKSVFHFDVQGSIAKSAHTGIPWLRYILSFAKTPSAPVMARFAWRFGLKKEPELGQELL